MDLGTLVAVFCGVGAAVGSFVAVRSGRLQGTASAMQVMEGRINLLEKDVKTKDALIVELKEQVNMLTELVTSKADVESVKRKLEEIHIILDRVAAKLEA